MLCLVSQNNFTAVVICQYTRYIFVFIIHLWSACMFGWVEVTLLHTQADILSACKISNFNLNASNNQLKRAISWVCKWRINPSKPGIIWQWLYRQGNVVMNYMHVLSIILRPCSVSSLHWYHSLYQSHFILQYHGSRGCNPTLIDSETKHSETRCHE